MEFVPGPAVHRVLCADCGTPIEPNSANLCVHCIRNTVDITEGIPKQSALAFCRNCDRFHQPPQSWIIAAPESRELLAICLKKLKGLNKVRLVDAGFIWTEPHSKRIKVKLTIQKEVLTSTIVQQIFQVEYLVQHTQCPDCAKLAAKNTWNSLVQVRQKVSHKRTFLYLEQLILKHGAQKDTISVKEVKDGLDFFYASRNHAIKMVEFLSGVVPVRSKTSEQLLSKDTHSGTSTYKFTYSIEIAPICKDDLVSLSLKTARSLGNINPLVICTRVGSSMQLLDPSTLQTCDISAQIFWRTPFASLANVKDLVEFTVLDIEPNYSNTARKGRWVMADAQVAVSGAFRSRGHQQQGAEDEDSMMEYDESTSGSSSQIFHTRTHLGAILQPGDTVLGYHLTSANYNNDDYASLPTDRIPDVVLVKKSYPNRRKKNRTRNWRLKSIAKEVEDEDGDGGDVVVAAASGGKGKGGKAHGGVVGRMGGRDQKKVDEDYELFLRDLEEDAEMRGTVNLYKVPGASSGPGAGAGAGAGIGKGTKGKKKQYGMDVDDEPPSTNDGGAETETETDVGDAEDIGPSLDELLDDLHLEDEDGEAEQ